MSVLNEWPIVPMLANSSEPFDSDNHLFEIKWDGTRGIDFVSKVKNTIQNRKNVNITSRYPDINVELSGVDEAILDGEIVCFNNGKPCFNDLQHREHLQYDWKIKEAKKIYPASYVIFDVLNIDGTDIRGMELIERKELLNEIVVESDNVIISDYIMKDGKKYFEKAVDMELEGIMGKSIHSTYVGKRSNSWLKIKKEVTMDCIICGITAGDGKREGSFGALILGAYHDGKLIHVGKAGTGLSDDRIMSLLDLFDHVPKRPKSPFDKVPDKKVNAIQWFEPQVVCEVSGMEITQKLKIRSPVFERLRTDKLITDCVI